MGKKYSIQNCRQERPEWRTLFSEYWIFMRVSLIPSPNYRLSQSETSTKAGTKNTMLFYLIIKPGLIPVFLTAILPGYILLLLKFMIFFPVSTFSVTRYFLSIPILKRVN